jgi:LPXTG-site transpeptidase (sortase) family protein
VTPVRTARRAVLPVVAAVVTAVLVIAGYLGLRAQRSDDPVGRWGATTTPVASPDPTVNPFGTPPPALSGAPTRLRVPAIGVDTRLESLRLGADGELVPPKDFGRAGWYADGTAPGDVGPAVIAGHVDSRRGAAVFYKLRQLDTGDTIEVDRGGATVRFTVVSTAWYPKSTFPTEQVYGPTPDRQLRLITCGGVFDRSLRSYRDNLVVYAVSG